MKSNVDVPGRLRAASSGGPPECGREDWPGDQNNNDILFLVTSSMPCASFETFTPEPSRSSSWTRLPPTIALSVEAPGSMMKSVAVSDSLPD